MENSSIKNVNKNSWHAQFHEHIYLHAYTAFATTIVIVAFFVFAMQVASATTKITNNPRILGVAYSVSPFPISTASPSPSTTATPTPTTSSSPASTQTPSPTPTVTVTPTPTPSTAPQPSPSQSPTPTPSPAASPLPKIVIVPKTTSTPSPSITPVQTPAPVVLPNPAETAETKPTTFRRGDVDGDEAISVNDILTLSNYLYSASAISCEDAADTNDDGRIDISDLVNLSSYISYGGDRLLPSPGSKVAGIDPTKDSLGCEKYPREKKLASTAVQAKQKPLNVNVLSFIDTDKDGINDFDEKNVFKTDPLNTDTDADGFSDGQEASAGHDPKDPAPSASIAFYAYGKPRMEIKSERVCYNDFVKRFNILKGKKSVKKSFLDFAKKASCYGGYNDSNIVLSLKNLSLIHASIPASAWTKRAVGNDENIQNVQGGGAGTSQLLKVVTPQSKKFRRGDANIDGKVDISDIVRITEIFSSTKKLQCEDAADANDDGAIDLSDAIYLSSWYSLGTVENLPDPGPFTLGFDPTRDSLGCEQYPGGEVAYEWYPRVVRTKIDPDQKYFITENGSRYVFPKAIYNRDINGNFIDAEFNSWYEGFKDTVQTISHLEMETYPIKGNITIRPGTYFVKIDTDSTVYAVEEVNENNFPIIHRASRNVLDTLYGQTWWNSRVITIADSYFVNYTIGEDLDGTRHPEHTLFTYGDGQIYLLEGGKKRPVSLDGMYQNYLMSKHIVVIKTLFEYPLGEPIEKFGPQIAVPRVARAREIGTSVNIERTAFFERNVQENTNNVLLGQYKFQVSGNPVTVTMFDQHFIVGNTNEYWRTNLINNVVIKDSQGRIVAGPLNSSGVIATKSRITIFTDSIHIPVGESTYSLYGDFGGGWEDNESLDVYIKPDELVIQEDGTQNFIVATPPGKIDLGKFLVLHDDSTEGNGSASAGVDAATLPSRLVVAGASATSLTDIRLKAINESIDITKLTVTVADARINSAIGDYTQISKIYLKLDGAVVGSSAGYNMGAANLTINLVRGDLTIPEGNIGKKLSVLADIVSIGNNLPGTESADIILGLGGKGSDGFTATGNISAALIPISLNDTTGSAVVLHKSVPQIVMVTPTNKLSAMSALHEAKITAVGGNVGIYRLSYVTTTSANVNLANGYTRLISCGGGCGGIGDGSQLAPTVAAGSDIVSGVKIWNMTIDSSQAHGKSLLSIANGATAIIDFIATATLTANVDSVSTSLLGDTATTTPQESAFAYKILNQGDFVWSDFLNTEVTVISGITSKQWYNGYLVAGLGATTTSTPITISE